MENVLANINISGIACDSRKVKKGDVFVAIPGFKSDGSRFVSQAIENGASVIVTESTEAPVPAGIEKIVVASARKALAELACRFYDHPSNKLRIIGITGTNGKTTTAYLIQSILKEAGYKTKLLGTIDTPTGLTTPEAIDLQKWLAQCVKDGVTHVVMEVSSHALELDRVWGVDFDVAIFTNLTHDHLDFHKDMESYFRAKKMLFEGLGKGKKKGAVAIVNVDDAYGKRLIEVVNTEVVTYGLVEAKYELHDTKSSSLPGKYNQYNILAAYECGLVFDIPPRLIKKAIENIKPIPGRFEMIECGQPFKVIVDFAHTPDALEKLLSTVAEGFKPSSTGRIILVFGCPGERDKGKRPIMGKIAEKYSDYLIITTDDPHNEPPEKIISDITTGMSRKKPFETIVDRREAIKQALQVASKDDIIILAGRGHEQWQDVAGEKVEIDDRAIVKKLLNEHI